MGLFFPCWPGGPLSPHSPLDSDRIAEAARQGLPTVLLSTPTFLRSYIKRIPRDAFGTLRLAVTGAERLPRRDGLRLPGPVWLPGAGRLRPHRGLARGVLQPSESPCGVGADSLQSGNREGSVGRLLPGLAMRLHDPRPRRPSEAAASWPCAAPISWMGT